MMTAVVPSIWQSRLVYVYLARLVYHLVYNRLDSPIPSSQLSNIKHTHTHTQTRPKLEARGEEEPKIQNKQNKQNSRLRETNATPCMVNKANGSAVDERRRRKLADPIGPSKESQRSTHPPLLLFY